MIETLWHSTQCLKINVGVGLFVLE